MEVELCQWSIDNNGASRYALVKTHKTYTTRKLTTDCGGLPH